MFIWEMYFNKGCLLAKGEYMRNCKCSNCGTEYEIADDQEPICPGCGERVNNDNQEESHNSQD